MECKETLIKFFAVVSSVTGAVLLLHFWGCDLEIWWPGYLAGVLLLSAGITVIWTRIGFHRG
jgi:hypothetical protein